MRIVRARRIGFRVGIIEWQQLGNHWPGPEENYAMTPTFARLLGSSHAVVVDPSNLLLAMLTDPFLQTLSNGLTQLHRSNHFNVINLR